MALCQRRVLLFLSIFPPPPSIRLQTGIVCDCRQYHCHNICHYRPHIFSSLLSLRFFLKFVSKISKMFILFDRPHSAIVSKHLMFSLVHSLNNNRININLILCCDYFICLVFVHDYYWQNCSFVLCYECHRLLFYLLHIFSYSFLFSSLCKNTLLKFQSQCDCVFVWVSLSVQHGNLIHSILSKA